MRFRGPQRFHAPDDGQTPAEIFAEPERATVAPTPVDARTVALVLLAILAAILVLQVAQAVFIPMVLSVLISYALEPMVVMLTRIKIPRAVGSALALFALAGLVVYGIYAFSDDAIAILEDVPRASQKVRASLHKGPGEGDGVIEKVHKAATEIEKTATEAAGTTTTPTGVMRVQVEEKPIDLRTYVWWGGSSIAALVTQMIIIFFFVYFLLLSGDLFKRKLVKIAGPSLGARRLTVEIIDEIGVQIERFLLVQLSASLVVAVLCVFAFHWVGLERATLWGIVAGLLTSIPYLGAVITVALVSLAAFLQFGTLPTVLLIAGVAFAIRSLETMLLTPWLSGKAARMNLVAVFASLLFWGWVWGPWGMLLAMPMMVVVKSIADRIEGLKAIGELLGD
jgi:predicted PurR-regulated permease PerM